MITYMHITSQGFFTRCTWLKPRSISAFDQGKGMYYFPRKV